VPDSRSHSAGAAKQPIGNLITEKMEAQRQEPGDTDVMDVDEVEPDEQQTFGVSVAEHQASVMASLARMRLADVQDYDSGRGRVRGAQPPCAPSVV
jgi:hypothetical protein